MKEFFGVSMKFKSPLIEGTLERRYQRFFADVWVEDRDQRCLIQAHVPNTGSLRSVFHSELHRGARCWLSFEKDPKRKLSHTLQIVQAPTGALVLVNTHLSNKMVYEFLLREPDYQNEYSEILPEYSISKETRLDFALRSKDQSARQAPNFFIEVKHVTFLEGNCAFFPDAESTRAQKHLRELVHLIEKGNKAELIFAVQRSDAKKFAPADQIDPKYAELLRWAMARGLKVTALRAHVTPFEIYLTQERLPL